jgi:hypothetical protein
MNDMRSLVREVVRRTRQHHAIEHATIHLLAAQHPRQNFSGYSDPLGFTLYGDVTEEEVRRTVGNALLRLQAGERELAIHPNCGTNLATSGVVATMAAFVGSAGKRKLFDRFVTALLLVVIALVMSRPLGYRLQEVTTLADVADRWVAEIRPVKVGSIRAYRVLFD